MGLGGLAFYGMGLSREIQSQFSPIPNDIVSRGVVIGGTGGVKHKFICGIFFIDFMRGGNFYLLLYISVFDWALSRLAFLRFWK